MSDFTSNFWPYAIASVLIGSILACLLLLWFSGKTKAMTAHDNTTGHVWDQDLREMNNPLPRWWVYLFILTCLFGLFYAYAYPSSAVSTGSLGWTSQGQLKAEMDKAEASIAPIYAKFSGMGPEDLSKNQDAMKIGQNLFLNNCAQCHGSDARGAKGFPNLTDNDWLWGGEAAQIHETITKGRKGNMPPMAAAVGTPDDVKNVANYVLSLSNRPHDSLRASLGKPKFAACAACHGADGKGNIAMGAPNLSDSIWLHGAGEKAIIERITSGKINIMPAQEGRLNKDQIQILTAYVLSLKQQAQPK